MFAWWLGGLVLDWQSMRRERWSLKTLSDSDGWRVSLEPVSATVEQLRELAPPRDLPADGRVPPVELTTYVVKARVAGIKKMWGRDFHLITAIRVTGA